MLGTIAKLTPSRGESAIISFSHHEPFSETKPRWEHVYLINTLRLKLWPYYRDDWCRHVPPLCSPHRDPFPTPGGLIWPQAWFWGAFHNGHQGSLTLHDLCSFSQITGTKAVHTHTDFQPPQSLNGPKPPWDAGLCSSSAAQSAPSPADPLLQ